MRPLYRETARMSSQKMKDERKKLLPRMTSHKRNESFYADIYADVYRDFLDTTQRPVLLEPSRRSLFCAFKDAIRRRIWRSLRPRCSAMTGMVMRGSDLSRTSS